MIALDGTELAEGIRVGLELPKGGTCVARVERIAGDTIDLRLLDDIPEGALQAPTVIDLFVTGESGLYRWMTRMTGQPTGDTASVTILGPARVLQRRQNPRVTVDLAAKVSRVKAGRRGKADEARIIDLSRGGMKLVSHGALVTAETVEVAVDLGTGRLALTGRVVMAHPTPDGARVAHIAFSDELSGALETIDTYLSGRLSPDAQD